jgi:AdoMet-dependent heme synthase
MRSILEELDQRAGEKQVPLNALLELTYRCGLRCIHCYNPSLRDKEMSTAQYVKLLTGLRDLGCLFLIFSGGEPLARPDFFTIARQARRFGFTFTLFTNATLINSRTARKIARLLPLEVGVSLYSAIPEIHDGITGTPGSFRRTIQGIKLLIKAGVKVRLKCVLFQHTASGYKKVIALARDLGADYEFDPVLTPGRDGDKSILRNRVKPAELEKLFMDSRVLPLSRKKPLPAGESALQILCSAGVSSLSLAPNGDVFPCVQLPLKAGNILTRDLPAIWRKAPVFKKLRKLANRDLKACWTCRLKYYCGRCPGLALLEEGDLLAPSQVACLHAKVVKKVSILRHR